MGCVTTLPRSSSVDVEQHQKKKYVKYKLLLLGPSESGKSTLIKQIRSMHGTAFDQSELLAAKPLLSKNIIESMQTLAIYVDIIDAHISLRFVSQYLMQTYPNHHIPESVESLCFFYCRKIGLRTQNVEICNRVATMTDTQTFTRSHYEDFVELWADPYIKKIYYNDRHRFQLTDNVEYLFQHMKYYWRDEYIPSYDDLLRLRNRTSGFDTLEFSLRKRKHDCNEMYQIFDLGGSRNARKKWIHFCGNTLVVMFVASIAGYNQVLWEDDSINRMEEAINLFRGVFNLDILRDAHFVVLLNKSDLFERKIGTCLVKNYFDDFEGNEEYQEIVDFFIEKFRCQWIDTPNKVKPEIHFHVTCAIDIHNVENVFQSVRNIIMKTENKSGSGFL